METGFDFEELAPENMKRRKQTEADKAAHDKAEKSVDQARLRKQMAGPTPAEIRQTTKEAKEMASAGSLVMNKNQVAKIKTTCQLYTNYFAEKYPEIKKFTKPAERDGLEEWKEYLVDIQTVIGNKKADQRFDTMLQFAAIGVERASLQFPHLFGFHNLSSPLSFSQVVTSPQFIQDIDDEKHEFIFTHQGWFASGYLSRLLEAITKAGFAVAAHNAQSAAASATSPAKVDELSNPEPKPRKPREKA